MLSSRRRLREPGSLGDSMKTAKSFLLTEAAAMVPLVRRILRDVRSLRSELARRQAGPSGALTAQRRRALESELAFCLEESARLGVEITPGVRCEALFPFEHRWIGAGGDGKLRPAYFVYNDANETIREWFFAGWPSERREPAPEWWTVYRPSQRRFRVSRQAAT